MVVAPPEVVRERLSQAPPKPWPRVLTAPTLVVTMPELPELEAIRSVLARRVVGHRLESVRLLRPIVVRNLLAERPEDLLPGRTIQAIDRRGKFLLLRFEGGLILAINPMLAGKLQLAPPEVRPLPRTVLVLRLSSGEELRYADARAMGKLYLTRDLGMVPGFAELGPEALEIPLDEFRARLRRHPGEIKNILTKGRLVAGVGNAYADEILHRAKLSPFRRRPTLTEGEQERLYEAMLAVLLEAVERVGQLMGEDIALKPRHWLAVHLKGGQPCPVCATPISEIRANQRVTSYCRSCQPGTLVESWRRRR